MGKWDQGEVRLQPFSKKSTPYSALADCYHVELGLTLPSILLFSNIHDMDACNLDESENYYAGWKKYISKSYVI